MHELMEFASINFRTKFSLSLSQYKNKDVFVTWLCRIEGSPKLRYLKCVQYRGIPVHNY